MESIFKRLIDLAESGKIEWQFEASYLQESRENLDWEPFLHGIWVIRMGKSSLALCNYTGVLQIDVDSSERPSYLPPDRHAKPLLGLLAELAAEESSVATEVHKLLDTLEESKE